MLRIGRSAKLVGCKAKLSTRGREIFPTVLPLRFPDYVNFNRDQNVEFRNGFFAVWMNENERRLKLNRCRISMRHSQLNFNIFASWNRGFWIVLN